MKTSEDNVLCSCVPDTESDPDGPTKKDISDKNELFRERADKELEETDSTIAKVMKENSELKLENEKIAQENRDVRRVLVETFLTIEKDISDTYERSRKKADKESEEIWKTIDEVITENIELKLEKEKIAHENMKGKSENEELLREIQELKLEKEKIAQENSSELAALQMSILRVPENSKEENPGEDRISDSAISDPPRLSRDEPSALSCAASGPIVSSDDDKVQAQASKRNKRMAKETSSPQKRRRPRHSQNKKCKCPLCPKQYVHARSLRRHILEKHKEDKDRPEVKSATESRPEWNETCPYCFGSFVELRKHKKICPENPNGDSQVSSRKRPKPLTSSDSTSDGQPPQELD